MKTFILVDPEDRESIIINRMEMNDEQAAQRNNERAACNNNMRWVVESVKDCEGNDINVRDYIKSLHDWPSYAQKVMGTDGRPALVNCCYAEPRCGCKIEGCGTLQFPLTIKFCEKHST